MGYISNLAKGTKKESLPGSDAGRRLWREVFGTDKETPAKPKVTPGGSYARSVGSTDAAFTRLLQAMRSMAPGGWSDDRWEQTRHYTGIPYVATDRLGRRLSRAEFQVFIKDPNHPDGKRAITENDPPQGDRQVKPYDLVKLLEAPNNQDHFGLLMWRWKQQLNLTGTALTWMVPNVFGAPTELYCVPTAIAIPQPAVNPNYPDGYYRIQPVYPYGPFSSYPTPNSAVGAAIPAQWMLRFQYPHPLLRYDGYSPLTGMRLHIDEAEMIDRSRHYSMRHEVNPSAIIGFDDVENAQPLPPEEVNRIHAEFENSLQGPENAGRLFVNHLPGQHLEPWGKNPIDMAYQEGWDQLTNFILGGGFGITKPAAGMIEDSSYASLYATLKQLDLVTLDPDCYLIAAYLTRHLACFFGDNLIVEVRCPRIDDHDIKFTKIDKLQAGKAITKNELRKELDMPLTQEEWGADIAGDPSAAEQEQQEAEMEAQQQQMGEGGPMQEPGPGQEAAEEEEPAEVTQTRPRPGPLGEGALGPRMKSLFYEKRALRVLRDKPKRKVMSEEVMELKAKTFYDLSRKVCLNGHTK